MRLAVHGVVFFQATSSASGILKEGCVERCATRHDVPKIWGLSLWVWTMPARPQSFTTCILARRLAWRIHGTVPDIDVCNYHDLWLSSSAINVLGVNIFGSDGAFDHNSRKNRRSVQVVMTQPTIGSNAGFLVHSNVHLRETCRHAVRWKRWNMKTSPSKSGTLPARRSKSWAMRCFSFWTPFVECPFLQESLRANWSTYFADQSGIGQKTDYHKRLLQQKTYVSGWSKLLQDTDAIIFVVDSNDQVRVVHSTWK